MLFLIPYGMLKLIPLRDGIGLRMKFSLLLGISLTSVLNGKTHYSLEKRVVLRGLVVQHLLSNGLIKKSSSLVTLFSKSDKVFLQKYVRCFWDRELTSMWLLWFNLWMLILV